MMDDDRRRALLGNELEGARQFHAQSPLGGQQLEERRMILEIRTRAIAPRVALATAAGNSQLVLDAPVQPLGERLGRLHREPVQIKRFRVLAGVLQLLELPRRLRSEERRVGKEWR